MNEETQKRRNFLKTVGGTFLASLFTKQEQAIAEPMKIIKKPTKKIVSSIPLSGTIGSGSGFYGHDPGIGPSEGCRSRL